MRITQRLAVLTCSLLLACASRALLDDEGGGSGGGDDGGDGDDGDDGGDGDTGGPPLGPPQVDILFVADNSGSMGEEQGKIGAGFDTLITLLESAGVGYRIGVTTTDNGNPECAGGTSEGGAFRLTSCAARLEEFIFEGTSPYTDKRDEGCLDGCGLDSFEVVPTTTAVDPTPRVRPWLEHIGGQTNLEDGYDLREVLACVLPQGIDGCGFESHLESMYKSIMRTKHGAEASYGFMRDDAHLLVIFMTDEVDCSYRVECDEIFRPEGNRVFWSDPEAFVTSAACWNAGVSCVGGPGTYDSCNAQNKNVLGELIDSDEDAVLHPVSRYVNLLREIEADKRARSNASVFVAAITGVPEGYEDGVEIVYRDTDDVEFQHDYGIGPACESATGRALPPVRVREVAEGFAGSSGRLLSSVCAASYDDAFTRIAGVVIDHVGTVDAP